MRVLYLTYTPFPGKASTTVPTEGWFKYLKPAGLEPVLVSHCAGPFHHWAASQGVPAYEVSMPMPNKWWPFPFLRALARIRRIVRRHRVALIHCNEENIYPFAHYLARSCGVPIVVSVHFTLPREFSVWAFGRQRAPRRVFFVSRSSLEASRDAIAGVVPERDWRVLYNGIDMRDFQVNARSREESRAKYGLGSSFVMGAACALRPRKQLEHLFEAAARLSAFDCKVLLAGAAVPGDEDYAKHLMLLGKEKLGDRLVYAGKLDELQGFYNALDVFVNTSREESFGLSALEAMACGCPVVGYPSVSIGEVVLPGGGEIVAQDNADALVAALERRMRCPEEFSTAREQARQRAKTFDIETISRQLWEEYQSLLNGAA
jgi:glycosyltransferase involved in cell wall biosynthesis